MQKLSRAGAGLAVQLLRAYAKTVKNWCWLGSVAYETLSQPLDTLLSSTARPYSVHTCASRIARQLQPHAGQSNHLSEGRILSACNHQHAPCRLVVHQHESRDQDSSKKEKKERTSQSARPIKIKRGKGPLLINQTYSLPLLE